MGEVAPEHKERVTFDDDDDDGDAPLVLLATKRRMLMLLLLLLPRRSASHALIFKRGKTQLGTDVGCRSSGLILNSYSSHEKGLL